MIFYSRHNLKELKITGRKGRMECYNCRNKNFTIYEIKLKDDVLLLALCVVCDCIHLLGQTNPKQEQS